MNLLQKAVSVLARSVGLADPRLNEILGSVDSSSGERVTPTTALGISAVWGCVSLLAGTIASLPLMVYRRQGSIQAVAYDHPLYRLLHESPNYDQTAMDFWEFIGASLELQGDGIARIERSGDRVIALHPPVPPEIVDRRRLSNGDIGYRWSLDGKSWDLRQRDVLHVRGFGGNPLGGLSTLAFARQSLGLAMAIERAAGETFRNGIRPSGVYQTATKMTPEQRVEIEEHLAKRHAGAINAGRPMVLGFDLKWEQLTINPNDAQMIESRSFSVEEICRFFGVPPFMVGSTEKVTSWGTGLEQQTLGFVKFTLRRRLRRIEQALAKQLLTPRDRLDGVSIEFNLEGLLRGDSASRGSFYQTGLQNGWRTINEVRALENLPPVPGGDVPRMQSQNVPISDAPGIGDNGGPPLGDDE